MMTENVSTGRYQELSSLPCYTGEGLTLYTPTEDAWTFLAAATTNGVVQTKKDAVSLPIPVVVWEDVGQGKVRRWEQVDYGKERVIRIFGNVAAPGAYEDGELVEMHVYQLVQARNSLVWQGQRIFADDSLGPQGYPYADTPFLPWATLGDARRGRLQAMYERRQAESRVN